MQLVGIDFETFYGSDYTLSKLTTEEYCRDPRFETIMVAIKIDDDPAFWVPKPQVKLQLDSLHLHEHAVYAHHAHFDGLILAHHFGIRPKLWFDTLGMARALYGANGRLGLAALCEREGIGQKGHEVENAKGLRFADFTPQHLARYGDYSVNDIEKTYLLVQKYASQFARTEIEIHDQVIRMFTEPLFELDDVLLENYRHWLSAEKVNLLMKAGVQLDDIMSAERFAQALRDIGIQPPTKLSPTTGKITWAFAKTDPGMQQLQEHPDEDVQVLVEARLKNKTTIAERSAERLIGMARRGRATIYLKYSGASGTHRLSAGDKFNAQAMKRGGDVRKSFKAPAGCLCVVVDSSTIEARLLDWISGQDDMVEVYRKQDNKTGPDMYCVIAEHIYSRPINKKTDPDERQMGKRCIAEGTPVLTRRGWIEIQNVQPDDLLWDGDTWQHHSGLLHNGSKETLPLSGLWLTPDHRVWCGTQWKEAQFLEADASLHSQALAFAAANLPSLATFAGYEAACRPSSSPAAVGDLNTPWPLAVSRHSEVHDAHRAATVRQQANDIGNTILPWPTRPIVRACLTALAQLLRDATIRMTQGIQTTVRAVSAYSTGGNQTVPAFYGMSSLCPAGMTPRLTWIGETLTATTSPGTSGLLPAVKTQRTSAKLRTLRRKLPVYDLLSCGPKSRFTVWSDGGPLIVHNCKLGLGFGMGEMQFIVSVRREAKDKNGKPLILDPAFAKRVVQDVYRALHKQVVKFWRRCEGALQNIADGVVGADVDFRGIVKTCKDGLIMPNGLKILYPDLKFTPDMVPSEEDPSVLVPRKNNWGKVVGEWTFWNGRAHEKLYGAKVCENIIQCLARIIVFNQCLMAVKECQRLGYPMKWKHSVHDEGVFIAPAWFAPKVAEVAEGCFRTPLDWCTTLPLNCESGVAQRYGVAK